KMYLYDAVIVKQVGAPRPYNMNEDINVGGIDVRVPVTPIRGSFKSYQCDDLGVLNPEKYRGHNCGVTNEPNAEGLCYKDSFANWHCSMEDTHTSQEIARDAPPPGPVPVTQTPPAKKTPPTPPPANNRPKPTDKDQEAPAEDNGLPKPNLSAMSKWF